MKVQFTLTAFQMLLFKGRWVKYDAIKKVHICAKKFS